jgi:murein L,D-transpeptidase YcbB/YkuD
VERLHLLLRDANVSGGGTGDVFDAKTTAVVAEFQTAIGLRADGKVGPLTMIALYRIGLPDAMPRLRAKAAIESRTTWSSDGDSGGLGP